MAQLTGRTRHRIAGLFKKRLVLQVEYEYIHVDWCGNYADTRRCKAWRDATAEDITVEPAQEGKE